MTDHQLARATAEKCASLTTLPNHYATEFTALILASYHERDRAATAMGGETPRVDAEPKYTRELNDSDYVTVHFARTLEQELNEARSIYLNKADQLASENARAELAESELKAALRGQKTLCDNLESITTDLTALQESNREVVKEWQERNAQQLAACDCAAMMDTAETHEKNKSVVRGNPFWSPAYVSVMRRTAECITLRTRLALADDLAKALEDAKYWSGVARGTLEGNSLSLPRDDERIEKSIPLLNATDATINGLRLLEQRVAEALRRWTAPQAGTTSRPTATEGGKV